MKPIPTIVASGLVVGGGIVTYGWLFGDFRTMKAHEPDAAPPPPGKTGYKLVDAMLPKLGALASANAIPLGLIAAWIAKESGGKITSHTSMDERGYFQLTPDESKALGLDHGRLSTDADYSLDAGMKLIKKYEGTVDDLNDAYDAAPRGSSLYWMLVKLVHTVGGGQTKKWVKSASDAGKLGSWSAFEENTLGQHWMGPQPKKWLPFMDSLYKLGRPLGFGSESAPLVSGRPRSTPLLGLDVFVVG